MKTLVAYVIIKTGEVLSSVYLEGNLNYVNEELLSLMKNSTIVCISIKERKTHKKNERTTAEIEPANNKFESKPNNELYMVSAVFELEDCVHTECFSMAFAEIEDWCKARELNGHKLLRGSVQLDIDSDYTSFATWDELLKIINDFEVGFESSLSA